MKEGKRRTGWFSVAAAAAVALGLGVGCGEHPTNEPSESAAVPDFRESGAADSDGTPAVDGIALAIVYDTSGSMREQVRNASGASEPKYVIAARALNAIVARLSKFRDAQSQPPRPLEVGIWAFEGAGVTALRPMGPFDAVALRQAVAKLSVPHADTPLGNGLAKAAKAAFASRSSRRHVLVVTDGMNTTGPEPADVMAALVAEAKRRETALGVHFVAFDVDAAVFEPVRKLGATVVPATDERTLDDQLGFILDRKILLEDEEPGAIRK